MAAPTTCFFCPNPLDGSEEHVILSGIGGQKASRLILCSVCNHHFGNTIDKEFLEALEPYTVIVNPVGRRKALNAKKRVTGEQGLTYELLPGGKLKVRYAQTSPQEWVADLSDADRALENAERAASALQERTGSPTTVTSRTGSQQPPPLAFEIRLDNFVAVRELLKWALNLLGMMVLKTDISRSQSVPLEKAFVRGDGAPPLAGYLERTLVPHMYQGLQHYVLLIQSPDASIYWEASAYGGVVACAGRLPPIAVEFQPVLYHVDPISGHHATEQPALQVPNDRCRWVPTFDATCQRRERTANEKLQRLVTTRVDIPAIIDECMTEVFGNESGVITQDHVNALSRCVAEKSVALMKILRGGSAEPK